LDLQRRALVGPEPFTADIVVQEIPEVVTVRLVAPGWTQDDERWLRHEISMTAAAGLELRLELVEDIPLTAAGKMRVVVNLLAARAAGEELQ